STTACLKRSSNTRLPSRRIPITGSTLLDDSTCIASTPQHGGHNRRGLAYSTQGCQYRTLTIRRLPGQVDFPHRTAPVYAKSFRWFLPVVALAGRSEPTLKAVLAIKIP